MVVDEQFDGRRARRERSRLAVIDAVFALVHDGKVPPTVEQVAERAGVSVSSIFRTFDGLSDLQHQAFDRFQERYAHLINLDVDATLDTAERVKQVVGARVELYAAAGPLLHIARQRALDYEPMANAVAHSRMRLADQVQRAFAPESKQLSPAEAANLIALIDATTSPEAFDVIRASHGRTERQISRTWRRAITALFDSWLSDVPTSKEPT